MKIDRRVFLSFMAGGAAGSALSPLPWKLMDDLSIWSQNWSWVPVPKDGQSVFVDTICSLCPGGCGITANKVGNRITKINGLEGHPVNDGGICSLGLSGLQLLYGPTRVRAPMQRVGSRGSGKWQEISWDKAISIVVDKLASTRSEGNADKVACISGSDQGTTALLLQRFIKSYGSKNFVKMPSGHDINSLAFNALCGNSDDSILSFDLENSDFVLSFGSGLVDGWLSPVRMMKLYDNSKITKLVQVETNFSDTAAKADQWIPINPGTEADLAFGIASFMIKHNLYDKEQLKKNVGSRKWQSTLLNNYSLENVSKITGVDTSIISNLAKSFVNSNNPVAVCGRGKGDIPVSFRDYASVHLLNIIRGNFNKQGGVWLCKSPTYVDWPSVCLDDISKSSLKETRFDGAGNSNYFYSEHLVNNLLNNLKTEKKSLKVLFVNNSNPCYSLHDTASTKNAFKHIPLIISFSSFMDETAAESDLILPNHTYLERIEDVPALTASRKFTIGISRPVVSPKYNTKHVGDTIINIAHMLGGSIARSFPWSNYEDCLQDSLGSKLGPIMVIRTITKVESKPWIEEDLEPIPLGKVDFKESNFMLEKGLKIAGSTDSFPFILLPNDSVKLPSAFVASPPFLMKSLRDTVLKGNDGFIDINPQTAEIIGLKQNDNALLSTPKGKVKVKINIYEGVRPGVITLLRGLGHTAYDEYVSNKGINVNDLIGSVKDPVLGHDAVWGIRASLVKA